MEYLMCYEGYECGYDVVEAESIDELHDIMMRKLNEGKVEYIESFDKWEVKRDNVITNSLNIVAVINKKD